MKIEKIEYKVRGFGYNKGRPMNYITLGDGREKVEDIIASILPKLKGPWMYLTGNTGNGFSTFLGGMVAVGLKTEVQILGNIQTPGWVEKPDNLVVGYHEGRSFNYYSVPKSGIITFRANTQEHLTMLQEVFHELRFTPACKWLFASKELGEGPLDLVTKYSNSRLTYE